MAGSDAADAMRNKGFGRGETDITAIARDVLLNDFGERTIGSLKFVD